MINYFQIGPMQLAVETEFEFPWTEEVKVFQVPEVSGELPVLHFKIQLVKEFSPIWGEILYRDHATMVMDIDGVEHRIHMLPGGKGPFALTAHVDAAHIEVYIDVRALPLLKWDRTLVGLFSLEHYCLAEKAFLLHSSYIIHEGKAIVFTAPSGTGKSTQAELWRCYAGAEIINGDRTLLMQKDGVWYASGFPVCGSSEYCLNQTAPVAAVICLSKAPDNTVTKLHPMTAMKTIYSQTFVNHWNAGDCEAISTLIEELIGKCPVYGYACTKEPEAVEVLKKVVKKL